MIDVLANKPNVNIHNPQKRRRANVVHIAKVSKICVFSLPFCFLLVSFFSFLCLFTLCYDIVLCRGIYFLSSFSPNYNTTPWVIFARQNKHCLCFVYWFNKYYTLNANAYILHLSDLLPDRHRQEYANERNEIRYLTYLSLYEPLLTIVARFIQKKHKKFSFSKKSLVKPLGQICYTTVIILIWDGIT